MTAKQLSVFVENKHGRLSEIVGKLADNGIDISALSLADTSDFGVLRLIIEKVDEAKAVLNDLGVIVKITEVTAVVIEDVPGGAAKVLKVMSDNDIAVEYMYACAGKSLGKAIMILRVDDPQKAETKLLESGFKRTEPSDIYG